MDSATICLQCKSETENFVYCDACIESHGFPYARAELDAARSHIERLSDETDALWSFVTPAVALYEAQSSSTRYHFFVAMKRLESFSPELTLLETNREVATLHA